MTRSILRIACLSVVGAVSSVATAHSGDDVTPPPVPLNIEVPEGNRPFLMSHAVGTQNYICLGAGLPWAFIGPQATLFDGEAEPSFTHFLSPNPIESGEPRATWQHSRDASAVWARAIQSSIDPNFVEPGAIPWLLLKVVGAQDGPTGGDRISATTFIQRVNTVGGSAPAGRCSKVGARIFVPYETDYVLYEAH